MPLIKIEEDISFTNRDIQEETDDRVLGIMTKIEFLGGDVFISGVKLILLRELKK